MEQKLINSFNLKAPIVPLHSIGGIEIGANISTYLSLNFDINIQTNGVYQTRYLYQNSLIIDVSIETGKILKLIAINNYVGYLLNKITIGSTVTDLFHATTNKGWNTDDFYIWNVEIPGIFIGLEGVNKTTFYDTNDLKRKIILIGMIAPNDLGNYDVYGEEWYIEKNRLLNKFGSHHTP